MLDQNDIKQIGTLLEGTEGKLKEFVREEFKKNNKELTKEIVGQVVVEVGEFITDRVLPQIDELADGLAEVKQELTEVKKTITTLPTKDDLDRVAADVKGTIVAKLRTEDDKVNLLIKFLKEGNVLTEEQWKALRAFHVFPSIEI